MTQLINLYHSHYACAPEACVPLTGSASNRKYFRLSGGGHSCIGVVGTEARENEAFLTLAGHFRANGINVPEVYAVSEDRMAYIQEDLGDAVLFDMLAKARKTGEGLDEVATLLCKTMSMLPKIQFEGAEGLDFSV